MFGGIDELRPQAEQDVDVTWLCITDDPELEAPEPWQVRVEAPLHEDPCLSAKVYKALPGKVATTDRVVWIDANMQVTSPKFAISACADAHDAVALWRHPRRDCIYDEAEATLGTERQGGRYEGLPIREQVEHYRSGGHPEHGGLYACGTVAWDLTDPRAHRLGSAWLAECMRWTYQDQLSFPVVSRRLGIVPGVFGHPLIERRRPGWIENRWLRIHPHLLSGAQRRRSASES
jgi:hypothetical protein